MLRLYLNPRNWPSAMGLALFRFLHLVLPFSVKLRLCRGLGRLMYRALPSRRHIVDVNLSLCFPEWDEAQRQRFAKRNFEHWGIALLETAMGWWGNTGAAVDNLTVSGAEHFEAAVAQGKGVLLLGAHFSTIDLAGTLFRSHFGHELPIHAVYRLQKSELLNAHMIKGRLKHVSSCVSKDDMRQLVRLVRRKEIVWYAPDHDFGQQNSVFAPFFGQTAATLTATSKLAAMSGAPVVLMEHHRNPDDLGYTLNFFPLDDSFPTKDDVTDATSVNQILEHGIMCAPEQYMWMHRRFKTQPDLPKNALYEK